MDRRVRRSTAVSGQAVRLLSENLAFMADTFEKLVYKLARKTGAYPAEAYAFVRDGLTFTVQRLHGVETPAQVAVMKYLAKNKLDLAQLRELYDTGQVTSRVAKAIEECGGIEKLNRHVSGPDLCWGLRDYAHYRWGRLAVAVLASWSINTTDDFGRIVFDMIDHELMQKQPQDRLEDFRGIYEFGEALHATYRIEMTRRAADA